MMFCRYVIQTRRSKSSEGRTWGADLPPRASQLDGDEQRRALLLLPPHHPSVSRSIMAVTHHQRVQWLNLFVRLILIWSGWITERVHPLEEVPRVTRPWRNRRDVGQHSVSPGSLKNLISGANLQRGSLPGGRVLARTCVYFPQRVCEKHKLCSFSEVIVSKSFFYDSLTCNGKDGTPDYLTLLACVPPARKYTPRFKATLHPPKSTSFLVMKT